MEAQGPLAGQNLNSAESMLIATLTTLIRGAWPPVLIALLLNAGITKIVMPETAQQSLLTVLPTAAHSVITTATVRAFAAFEVTVAAGLILPQTQLAAFLATIVMGVVFMAVGAVGKLRGSSVPCGCISVVQQNPLGLLNSSLGLLFIALGMPSVLATSRGVNDDQLTAYIVSAAAISTMLLPLWLNRSALFRVAISNRVVPR